jgi:hypothetical protein
MGKLSLKDAATGKRVRVAAFHLPENLVKLMPLPELERRCHEIVAEHVRFRQEVPPCGVA